VEEGGREGGRAGGRKMWMYVFGGNTLTESFSDVWRLELEEGWMEEGGEGGREGGGMARWEKVDVVGTEVRREGGREGGRQGRSCGRVCFQKVVHVYSKPPYLHSFPPSLLPFLPP